MLPEEDWIEKTWTPRSKPSRFIVLDRRAPLNAGGMFWRPLGDEEPDIKQGIHSSRSMITFNSPLRAEGLDPAFVKLARHQDDRHPGRPPYALEGAEIRGAYRTKLTVAQARKVASDIYQEIHGEQLFTRAS